MRLVSACCALLSLIGAGLLFHPAPSPAQSAPLPADRLGSVHFSTSCSADAQPVVVKGVALLHSFQYQQADQVFADAFAKDPHCAIALWGRAMTVYHQLWGFPSAKELAEAREDLARAGELQPLTKREREYIAAAKAFFDADDSLTHKAHVHAYSAAMAALHARFPDDAEAAEFYALSLVALAEDDVEPAANREKAIAILAPILRANPLNPGAAHYMIHATDTSDLAPQGLEAARAYAQIAPDSSHALHMPSHIFVRLGLWQEAIDSNIAAAASAARATDMHLSDAHYQTHAMDFLQYAYLQSGQESAARRVAAEVRNVQGLSPEHLADEETRFACRDALELHRWREAADLSVPAIRLAWQDTVYKVRAIGAARSGNIPAAKADYEKLTEAIAAREAQQKKEGYPIPEGESLDSRVTRAWILFAEGKSEEALEVMRAAAERQEARDVDSVGVPVREMLADMLLDLHRPAEALAEYKVSLKLLPNRFNSLDGAARAGRLAGNARDAHHYLGQLVKIAKTWPAADRPELREARELASGLLRNGAQ